MADWRHALDEWFAPGRDLPALQEAVTEARANLGAPPTPRAVVLSLHYPSAEAHEFGDVDGDGRSEDLAVPGDRARAVAWHVDEAIRRFEAAAFPDLVLWGFYWMREDIDAEDEEAAREAAAIVHARGYRMLWIPYYRATGFERWRTLGFDAAILQPNYAFVGQHGGRIRNDRLLETAALARRYGMGFEMEAGSVVTEPRDREVYLDYLAYAADPLGRYRGAARAWYQGHDLLRGLAESPEPGARDAYDRTCELIGGHVPARPGEIASVVRSPSALSDGRFVSPLDPDAPSVSAGPEGLVVELTAPRRAEELEVSLVRAAMRRSGIVSVEVAAGDGAWTPAGWASVSIPPRDEGIALDCVAAVPVAQDAPAAFRIRTRFADGAPPPAVDEVSTVSFTPGRQCVQGRLAVGAPYTIEPDRPRAYPDAGGMLTDGVAAEVGWTDRRSVGWSGTGARVVLDLGADRIVDEVVVYCDGGGSAGVTFPPGVSLELFAGPVPPPLVAVGRGPSPPEPVAAVSADAGEVEVGHERSESDGRSTATGRLRLRPARGPATARWALLRFTQPHWLMLSEIEVWGDGANHARSASYRLSPRPSPREGSRYDDDGVLLTDGVVAASYGTGQVVGWRREAARVTVDLGGRAVVHEVRAHVLGGGEAGIVAPPEAEVLVSDDGGTWSSAGRATLVDPGGGGCTALTHLVAVGREARYVRLALAPSAGWTMLSEIEVR